MEIGQSIDHGRLLKVISAICMS